MVGSNLRLLIFAVGLLLGIQVPGFFQDYLKRVDAHRVEAGKALQGFRETAQGFFNGDLDALVAHYRNSQDPVFHKDADNVAHLVERSRALEAEWSALQGPWYQCVWHMLTQADHALVQETWLAYDYQVLLNPVAVLWGLACGLLLTWLISGFGALLAGLFGRRQHLLG